jgi:hypothetical protein
MRTAQEVREYLEGVRYPARPEDLIATAQANGAPPSFFETLGLVPTAIEFYNPGEVVEQLERLQGLGSSGKVTKQSMPEAGPQKMPLSPWQTTHTMTRRGGKKGGKTRAEKPTKEQNRGSR